MDDNKEITSPAKLNYTGSILNLPPPNSSLNHYSDYKDFKGKTTDFEFLSTISSYIQLARRYKQNIYSYRNLSSAVPSTLLDPLNDEEKKLYLEKLLTLFLPPIQEMLEIKHFADSISQFIADSLFSHIHNPNVSKNVILKIISLLDEILSIHFIISYKSSLVNDFSRLKRDYNIYSMNNSDFDLAQNINELQNFYSNSNYIAMNLREAVQKKDGYIFTIQVFMDFLLRLMDSELLHLPEERFAFMRCLLFSIFLADNSSRNFFREKFKNLSKVRKCILKYPFIPLYNDCSISVKYVLSACPNFEKEKQSDWISSAKPDKMYLTLSRDKESRVEFDQCIFALRGILNDDYLNNILGDEKALGDGMYLDFLDRMAKTIADGVKLLAKFKMALMMQSSYKMENGINDETYHKIKERERKESNDVEKDDETEKMELRGDISNYEKKVRYNYSRQDLVATIHLISYIKEISQFLTNNEHKLLPHLLIYYYHEIQKFLQNEMNLTHPEKFKKFEQDIKDEIKIIFDFVSDLSAEDINLKAKTKRFLLIFKKKRKQKFSPSRIRCAFATDTQVMEMYHITGLIYNQPKMKKMLNKSEERIKYWQNFYYKIHNYFYLTNLKENVEEISDMSFIWFKESSLAFSGCLQFPLELSFPGIIAEQILSNLKLLRHFSIVFKIYNDAGMASIKKMNKQFLYDEVEAECSLIFDKTIFKLSRITLTEAVNKSAYIHLPTELRKSDKTPSDFGEIGKFISIASIEILGRDIKVKELVSSYLNNLFREYLDNIITKFELLGFTYIIELQEALKIAKTAHENLSIYLTMDKYEEIFHEVNEDISIGNFHGRIFSALLYSIRKDFVPNFSLDTFAGKFVRRGWKNTDEESYNANVSKFANIESIFGNRYTPEYRLYLRRENTFVGLSHFRAMIELTDSTKRCFIFEAISDDGLVNIARRIDPYFSSIKKAIPIVKIPPPTFGIMGVHTAIELKLKPIDEYTQLRSHVFQSLKEFGNSLAFVYYFDIAFECIRNENFVLMSPLLGVEFVDREFTFKKKQMDNLCNVKYVKKADKAKLSRIIEEIADNTQSYSEEIKSRDEVEMVRERLKSMAKNIDEYLQENVVTKKHTFLSGILFKYTLTLYESKFAEKFWGGVLCSLTTGVTSAKDMASIANTFKFIVCNSMKDDKTQDDLAVFGDGFTWALTFLLRVLNQVNRSRLNDFCSHLANLHEEEKARKQMRSTSEQSAMATSTEEMTAKITNFVTKANKVSSVTRKVIMILESHYNFPHRYFETIGKGLKTCWIEDTFEDGRDCRRRRQDGIDL